MNIQTRKLNLIEAFLRISDVKLIEKLESLVSQEKRITAEKPVKKMSVKEFHEMIDKAEDDKKNGRIVSHEDLKKRIKSWK